MYFNPVRNNPVSIIAVAKTQRKIPLRFPSFFPLSCSLQGPPPKISPLFFSPLLLLLVFFPHLLNSMHRVRVIPFSSLCLPSGTLSLSLTTPRLSGHYLLSSEGRGEENFFPSVGDYKHGGRTERAGGERANIGRGNNNMKWGGGGRGRPRS